MDVNYRLVRRGSPRFQLIRKEIDSLCPTGTYHFVADADGLHPVEYKATRQQLEEVFARAMLTPSYRENGRFHQDPWPKADQFSVGRNNGTS